MNPNVTIHRWRDQQYAAAFYLFGKLRWAEKRQTCFAHVVSTGIEKAKLLKVIRPWSHGEQILVKVALDLFDPGCVKENRARPVDFGEAAGTLDSEHLQHVINAVRIARGEARPDDAFIAEIMREIDAWGRPASAPLPHSNAASIPAGIPASTVGGPNHG